MADRAITITFHKDMTRAELDRAKLVLDTLTHHYEASANADKLLRNQTEAPVAKCVGRDGNVDPEIAAKLFGAEPSVGNEPMKETRFGKCTDYKPE